MIVDSSALIAIALDEPEIDEFIMAIRSAETCRMSAGTWIELSAVATRGKIVPLAWLDMLQSKFNIILEPVSPTQAEIGHRAYREFGLGSGHPARLNFGDCFAYALAKATGEPLLFKGNDFNHTDLYLAPEASYPPLTSPVSAPRSPGPRRSPTRGR